MSINCQSSTVSVIALSDLCNNSGDETTLNTWNRAKKSWSLASERNFHAINKVRYSITLYGAIGTGVSQTTFHLDKGTNAVGFLAFLEKVKSSLQNPKSRPFLLMDQVSEQ